MTFLTIISLLILGLLLLFAGFVSKKKWVIFVSIIPLAVSGWHLVTMLTLGI